MDSLKIKKAKFVGHSWGGPYALAFAIEHPERVASIVCVGPGYLKFDNKANKKLFALRMAKLSESDCKLYNQFSRKKYSDLSPSDVKKFADMRCIVNLSDTTNLTWKLSKIQRSNPSDRTNELMMNDLEKINFDLTPKLKSLVVPISIIIGKDDPISFLIPDYQKSAPEAEVLWVNQAGHYPMYEQPNEFYPKLMQALKK